MEVELHASVYLYYKLQVLLLQYLQVQVLANSTVARKQKLILVQVL